MATWRTRRFCARRVALVLHHLALHHLQMSSVYQQTVVETRVGDAHRAPVQYFLDEILPPVHPNLDVDKVYATMRRSGKKGHRIITRDGKWRGFPTKLVGASNVKRRQRVSFRVSRFTHVVNAIVKAGTRHGVSSSLEIVHNDVQGADFDTTRKHSLPDAFAVPCGTNQDNPVRSEDISVAGFYTTSTKEEAEEDVSLSLNQSV